MRALDPEVVDAIWQTIEPLLPPRSQSHPLGCHRQRIDDRLCFRGRIIRLVTDSSWVDIEALLDHAVSDTTLRARRNEWIAAGIFDTVCDQAVTAFDRIIRLDLDIVAIDGFTKRHVVVKEPAPTQPIDASSATNGHSPSKPTASRSAGTSTARTAATSPCSNPPWHRSTGSDSSPTSGPSASTGATTTPRSGPCSTISDSTNSTSNDVGRNPRKGYPTSGLSGRKPAGTLKEAAPVCASRS